MRLQQTLDRIIAEEGVPGVIAEVRYPDDSTWFGAAGVADLDTGRPRCRDEHFRIGSATKTFTSVITLQLAAEGRLSLDDTMQARCPGLVQGNGNDGNTITIRHLLAHTSGLHLYSMDPGMIAQETGPAFLEHRCDSYLPEELVATSMAHPPEFAPGSQWRYNNTGFIVAGMIIEKITGHTFAEELQQRIAGPLGLTHTYMPSDETVREPHARSYTKALRAEPDSPVYDATELHPSRAWTAGGMVSSLADMNRFFSVLLGGKLLPPEQQRELLTTKSTDGAGWIPDTRYGLAVYTQTLSNGVELWGNGGAITGTWTISLGTADGGHRLTANFNGDWGNLLGAFDQLAEAEFGS